MKTLIIFACLVAIVVCAPVEDDGSYKGEGLEDAQYKNEGLDDALYKNEGIEEVRDKRQLVAYPSYSYPYGVTPYRGPIIINIRPHGHGRSYVVY